MYLIFQIFEGLPEGLISVSPDLEHCWDLASLLKPGGHRNKKLLGVDSGSSRETADSRERKR